jgi:hypothetical protein
MIKGTFAASAVIACLLIAGSPTLSEAISKVVVKTNTRTGAVEVTATGVGANPRWGVAAGETDQIFADQGACFSGGTLTKCHLGATGTLAEKTLPPTCALCVGDDSGPDVCVPYIKKCAVGARIGDASFQSGDPRLSSGTSGPLQVSGWGPEAAIISTVTHPSGLREGIVSTNLGGGGNANPPYMSSLFKARFQSGVTSGYAFLVMEGDDSTTSHRRAWISADGSAGVATLTITGGSDLVEGFNSNDVRAVPGSVLVVDRVHHGKVKVSTWAYDTGVMGVVSGAGGIKPGIHLGQDTAVTKGKLLVAMTGRVYVRASAENGAIHPGDLLTSAALPGRAMKATDPKRSFGAVIGKALSSLDNETGLVLALVNLQ